MSVSLSLGIIGAHQPLSSIGTMASKGLGPKKIIKRGIGDVVEHGSMSLPMYINILPVASQAVICVVLGYGAPIFLQD